VQDASGELLADARLTRDQDREVVENEVLHLLEEPPGGLGSADDIAGRKDQRRPSRGPG